MIESRFAVPAAPLVRPSAVLFLAACDELDGERLGRSIEAVAGPAIRLADRTIDRAAASSDDVAAIAEEPGASFARDAAASFAAADAVHAVWALAIRTGRRVSVAIALRNGAGSSIEIGDRVDAIEAHYGGIVGGEPEGLGATLAEIGGVPWVAAPSHDTEIPRTAFPGERPSGRPSPTRSTLVRNLAPATSAALEQFARLQNCPPALVFFAALPALLHRYSRDPVVDVAAIGACAGAPDGQGRRPAAQAVAAHFEFAESSNFRTVVQQTRAAARSAAPPAIAFDLRMRPDSQTVFSQSTLCAAGLQGDGTAAVTIDVRHAGERYAIRWRFDRDRYEDATIERIAGHYERLLAAVVAHPERPIAGASLVNDEERARRIAAGRGPQPRYERDRSVVDVWQRQVEATPDAVAIVDVTTSLTYVQADRRANRLANYLIAAGLPSGASVGVAFDRSIDVPLTLLAILKAGAAYVPLDPSYPRERLDAMIADAACTVVISRQSLAESTSFAGRVVRLDRETAAIDRCTADAPARTVAADALAYITYTSGSTGRPKGVMVRHRGIVRLVRNADYAAIAPRDGFLLHAPLAFDASTFEIWGGLLNGARLGIPRPGLLSIPDLAAAIERFDVSILFLTTALFGRLVDSGLPAFARIRQLLTGGEVASPAHMCRFIAMYPGCRLIAVYGPTENTTFSTWHPLPTAAAVGSNVPIGRPIANSTAYVVDAGGELAAIGETGELWVGGDGVAAGYAHLPDLTHERFAADPFDAAGHAGIYKTGDRARWRTDDVLEFLGRTDDQVKIRGFRIELGEIEAVLQAHPAVQDAAVVVATIADEKSLAAFVIPQRGDTGLGESALRELLVAKLPRYMLPHRISIVAALPEHASGKLDRVALARTASSAAPVAATDIKFKNQPIHPRGTSAVGLPGARQRQMQRTIAEIWQTVLRRDSLPNIDDNFFDAGGDSLKLLTVHARLASALGTEVSIMVLFEHTTIRKLAALLTSTLTQG